MLKRIYPVQKHCGGTIIVVLGYLKTVYSTSKYTHTVRYMYVLYTVKLSLTTTFLQSWPIFWSQQTVHTFNLLPLYNTEPLLHYGNGQLNSLLTTTSYSVAEERSIPNLISYCIKVTHIIDFCFCLVIVLLIYFDCVMYL